MKESKSPIKELLLGLVPFYLFQMFLPGTGESENDSATDAAVIEQNLLRVLDPSQP